MSGSSVSRVAADAGVAGVADGGVGVVDLLHHRADEAGEFRHRAFKDRAAEIDIAEHAVERILVPVIRRRREQGPGRLRPIVRRGDGERFLVLEVMEERALGDARPGAQFVDRGCDVALLPDHGEGRVQQLLARRRHRAGRGKWIAHEGIIPTSRYKRQEAFKAASPAPAPSRPRARLPSPASWSWSRSRRGPRSRRSCRRRRARDGRG